MPTMFDDVYVKCPFFVASDKTRITCEGITDDCVNIIRFTTQAQKNQHRDVFCNAKYENCEVCKMLKEKYKE